MSERPAHSPQAPPLSGGSTVPSGASTGPDAATAPSGATVLGVIVPCRNESAVIARKLANLARMQWPAAARPHAVVVVDDESDDDTAARAREAASRLHDVEPAVTFHVVANATRPGKAGAIATGLDTLGTRPDLIVLTDADVVFEPDALVAVARAFADDAALGMACGRQRFVRALADDGSARGPDGAALVDAAGRYDRLTAGVRGLESACGRLFSVHGQLLAWRAALGIRPTPGVAADDLDLMIQVRERGLAVRRVRDATFLEVKTPDGPARDSQALRRARAYVQLWDARPVPRWPGVLDRLQLLAYRRLPLAAPWIFPVALVAFVGLAGWTIGIPAGAVAAAVVVLGLYAPPGQHLIALLAVIAQAVREERRGALGDRWETPRSAAG